MNEAGALIAVLAAIYLIDCVMAVPRAAAWFRDRGSRRAVPRGGVELFGGAGRGLLLCSPWTPHRPIFTASPAPFSISPEGACAWPAEAFNPGPRGAASGRVIRFDQPLAIAASGSIITVNGSRFADAGSPCRASAGARLLCAVAAAPRSARAVVIERALDDSLDARAARRRLTAFRLESLRLVLPCNALFVMVFAWTPCVLWWWGLRATWWALLAGVVALMAWIAWEFRRAHASLWPAETSPRSSALIGLALSPPVAMRAVDQLARDLFAPFHPLAVAGPLCSTETFSRFAQAVLREAHHPAVPALPPEGEEAARIVSWQRAAWVEVLERRVRRAGLDPRALLRPPEHGSARSWCPRCGTLYSIDEGVCLDCGGLPRAPLGAKAPVRMELLREGAAARDR